jgi:hypothetical protein
MVKKLRPGFLAGSLLLSALAYGQCTPIDCLADLPPSGGLCAASFEVGRVGEPYSDAISFHVTNACTPASVFDPTLAGASIRITQMGGFTFTELPAGLSGVTDQPTYSPPANGCGVISGTPSEAGVFAATVNILVNVNVWPFSLTCGGFGPISQNDNPISEARELIILPDPSFSGLQPAYCLVDGPALLSPTGTQGGSFSGPGVVGDSFDPALAGVGTHTITYVVTAQEGAAIAPATDSLEVTVTVTDCAVQCTADAGTLIAGAEPCLDDGEAALFALPNGDAVVPPGFEVLYVLTEGAGLVIVDAGGTPEFSVEAAGSYTIHTLVYDPGTLDLTIVEFGVTTGFDVNGLLIQGGGTICASLDVAGALFLVEECAAECVAFAGTLGGMDFVPCLAPGGSVELVAIPGGDAVVPPGFEVLYVLTEGAGLVIVDAGGAPEFTVEAEGSFTIHTLVYDPTTLDLSIVVFGVTTGFDVNALLIQGGGEICASLDVAGAAYEVVVCAACDADAGTLGGGGATCLVDGTALLEAVVSGNAVVPPGFEVLYVLTEGAGLVIVDAGGAPEFTVEAEGSFTIHTLVYDPSTLDLTIVEFGVTTGFDVNSLLVQGGGEICASLDVAGAAFTVEICTGMAGRDAGQWVQVFPNPGQGEINLRWEMDGPVVVELMDVSGRLMHTAQYVATRGAVEQLQLAGQLAAGTYVLRATTVLGHTEQRIMVGR